MIPLPIQVYAKYYHILGLKEGASKSEIKKAYYRKAKVFHPDINKHHEACEQFIEIQRAFDILFNGVPIATQNFKHQKKYQQHSSYSRMRDDLKREAYRKMYGNSKRYHQYTNQNYEEEYGPAKKFRKRFFSDEYDQLGRTICYGFVGVLLLLGGFLVLLPIFVFFFYNNRFLTTSTVLSTLMGIFILRYAYDWYSDLKLDFSKK